MGCHITNFGQTAGRGLLNKLSRAAPNIVGVRPGGVSYIIQQYEINTKVMSEINEGVVCGWWTSSVLFTLVDWDETLVIDRQRHTHENNAKTNRAPGTVEGTKINRGVSRLAYNGRVALRPHQPSRWMGRVIIKCSSAHTKSIKKSTASSLRRWEWRWNQRSSK